MPHMRYELKDNITLIPTPFFWSAPPFGGLQKRPVQAYSNGAPRQRALVKTFLARGAPCKEP